jgi:DNA helicase HerA-like ATPase
LSRLLRLKIFDNPAAPPPKYETMTHPGHVTIIDLNDTDSPQVNNLVIAEILRGLQAQQEENYQASEQGAPIRKVVIIIEEAHEFLSYGRIKQMPVLFEQVARIARRGRKRWLGLMFVTQLPQHLPDEVLGLINNYILHKIADANVISRLKRSIGGIDEGLWDRLPNLAPGQAIVSAASMARPLLVAIDPTPCKLRMVE